MEQSTTIKFREFKITGSRAVDRYLYLSLREGCVLQRLSYFLTSNLFQNAKPEREKKKQTKLSPPGAPPEVLNPQVISPLHIEREILLKKIETLRYTTREQKRTIARLRDCLKWKSNELDL